MYIFFFCSCNVNHRGLKAVDHLDGQHDVRVTLQHLHSVAVADVLEAHAIGRHDLVPHLYSILLGETTRIQPETTRPEGI